MFGVIVLAIHGQARIAVAHRLAVLLQVAEDLVVGAVLLDDVDHVLDRILRRTRKWNLLRRRFHAVRLQHHLRPLRQILLNLRCVERGQRPIQQRADVGRARFVVPGLRLLRLALGKVVRSCSLPLSRRHVELPASRGRQKCHREWHPLGRHKSIRLHHALARNLCGQLARVDHRHRIAGHVGHVEPAAVAVQRHRHRLRAKVALPRQPRIEVALHRELACAHIHRGHRIAIGQRNIERLAVGGERKGAGMRTRRNRARRLQQRQLAAHRLLSQIEFHNLRRIPQRDKGAASVLRNRQRTG